MSATYSTISLATYKHMKSFKIYSSYDSKLPKSCAKLHFRSCSNIKKIIDFM